MPLSTVRIIDLLEKYPSNARVHRAFERKPNGGLRPLSKPNKALNEWLKAMNKELNRQFRTWPGYMHGGIKGKSYVTHARPHVNRRIVITIDIRRCFDSVKSEYLAGLLRSDLRLDQQIASRLANNLCFRGVLAQGFATSNFLSNLYLIDPLDELFAIFAKQGFVLTNYVDDIAVSGAITSTSDTINQISTVLSRSRLAINKAKVTVMPASRPQVVCGLLVNKKLTLTKQLKRELFHSLATGSMDESSVAGWIANLNSIDKSFKDKFQSYAIKKKVLSKN